MPTVTPIQPRVTVVHFETPTTQQKRRVAAYARVSTDEDEQQNSYTAQVNFYTQHIQDNDEWEFVNVYTDEAVSGTSTKHRDGFNQMVRDAMDGKIDFIITKSVSRFARNTVDSLNTIRWLKEKGVEVYFEKENIYTMDSKGELFITIMSSLAQEESRSISENIKWGKRRSAAEGKVTIAYSRFLGYEKGKDGKPRIVEKEAETVRLIYRLFLQGHSLNVIAKQLTDSGVLTPAGGKQWNVSTLNSILQNEKYKGDALLQKTYVDDFLTKKVKINDGVLPKYYVEKSHPAIVSADVFDAVQDEMHKRRGNGRSHSGLSCFSSRIVCGECGGFFGSKVWHSTSQYRRTIWRCNHKYSGGEKCATPHVYEDDIKGAFVSAFNTLLNDREQAKKDCDEIVAMLDDTSALETQGAELRAELDVVDALMAKSIEENARVAQEQSEYNRRYDALTARRKSIKKKLDNIADEQNRRVVTRENAVRLLATAEHGALLETFDEGIWNALVERVTVHADGGTEVTFKDGRTVGA